MAFPMMSSTLGYLLPTSTPGLDHGHGITLGQDRYGGLVRIDVETNTEDCPNSNIFIAAESGSGKSTLAKDVILQERALYGAKVIVLGDPESEFGYFCMATGGSLSRVGRDCNISPFEPRNIGTADDAADDGSLASDLEVLAARESRARRIRARVDDPVPQDLPADGIQRESRTICSTTSTSRSRRSTPTTGSWSRRPSANTTPGP